MKEHDASSGLNMIQPARLLRCWSLFAGQLAGLPVLTGNFHPTAHRVLRSRAVSEEKSLLDDVELAGLVQWVYGSNVMQQSFAIGFLVGFE